MSEPLDALVLHRDGFELRDSYSIRTTYVRKRKTETHSVGVRLGTASRWDDIGNPVQCIILAIGSDVHHIAADREQAAVLGRELLHFARTGELKRRTRRST